MVRRLRADSGGDSGRDGGAKEQLDGKNPFSTDELLQFYGCVCLVFLLLWPSWAYQTARMCACPLTMVTCACER